MEPKYYVICLSIPNTQIHPTMQVQDPSFWNKQKTFFSGINFSLQINSIKTHSQWNNIISESDASAGKSRL